MDLVKEYERQAVQCWGLAEKGEFTHRLVIGRIASTWMRLACERRQELQITALLDGPELALR